MEKFQTVKFLHADISLPMSQMLSPTLLTMSEKRENTALFEYTQKFDGADLINLEVTEAEKRGSVCFCRF